MKNILITLLVSRAVQGYAQVITKTETTMFDAQGKKTQTVKKTTEENRTDNLNGVTFGIGMGWSYMFNNPKEYFLTTDAGYKLQVQELSRSSIVLSSVISIKLGKMAVQEQSDGTHRKKALVSAKRTKVVTRQLNTFSATEDGLVNEPLKWYEHFAVNVSLNLAEMNGGDIAFNKSIDGGIGLGYYFNEFTQVALFFDMLRVRQMRSYFVDNFQGQSIPNGTGVYNALDQNDNNLFYNKYYPGVSVKVVFSLGNK